MSKLPRLVKVAMRLLLSDKDTTKFGSKVLTRGEARKIVDEESNRIEARIVRILSKP